MWQLQYIICYNQTCKLVNYLLLIVKTHHHHLWPLHRQLQGEYSRRQLRWMLFSVHWLMSEFKCIATAMNNYTQTFQSQLSSRKSIVDSQRIYFQRRTPFKDKTESQDIRLYIISVLYSACSQEECPPSMLLRNAVKITLLSSDECNVSVDRESHLVWRIHNFLSLNLSTIKNTIGVIF